MLETPGDVDALYRGAQGVSLRPDLCYLQTGRYRCSFADRHPRASHLNIDVCCRQAVARGKGGSGYPVFISLGSDIHFY